MEGFRNVVRRSSGERSSSVPSRVESLNANGGGAGESVAVSSAASPSSLSLATRPASRSVSWLTCSKLCAICFVAGVVFGYTLKRRVRRLASKLLKYLKE
ncbi:uncharacterized protein LOC129309832 [Prosopis cineraria]|uniref:uncharacterized protein LOC129309832 n=1 Tax=Prosopis cineraria TaxID=364024 RepID=UPI00240F5566|nr:uncharacterized protein LOC129309832 [Prosopis cineraria]